MTRVLTSASWLSLLKLQGQFKKDTSWRRRVPLQMRGGHPYKLGSTSSRRPLTMTRCFMRDTCRLRKPTRQKLAVQLWLLWRWVGYIPNFPCFLFTWFLFAEGSKKFDLGRKCILQRGTWSRALRVKICLRGTQRQRRCKARPSNNPNQFKLFCDGIFENELIPYLCQSVEISVQKLEKSKSKPTQLVARLLPIQFHLQWVWCFVTWTLHNPLS